MHHTMAALSTAVADTATDIQFPEIPNPAPVFPLWVSVLAIALILIVATLEWRIMLRTRDRNINLNAIARSDPRKWRTHVVLMVMMVVAEAVWIICMLYLDYPHMSRMMTGAIIILAACILTDRMAVTIPTLNRIGMRWL